MLVHILGGGNGCKEKETVKLRALSYGKGFVRQMAVISGIAKNKLSGKRTGYESLLYISGAITELCHVDRLHKNISGAVPNQGSKSHGIDRLRRSALDFFIKYEFCMNPDKLYIQNVQYGQHYFNPTIIEHNTYQSHFTSETEGVLLKNTDPYPLNTYYWPSDKWGFHNTEIPELPGIYVISAMTCETLWHQIGSPEIAYIGMANNIYKRYSSHEQLKIIYAEYDIVKFSFIAFAEGHPAILRANERLLIKTLNPRLNLVHKIKNHG